MYILKDQNKNILLIAENKKQLIESLFNPVINHETRIKGTYSGYIEKVSSHRIDFSVGIKKYCINKFGVICLKNKLKEGKTLYTFNLDFNYKSGKEFVDSLTI